MAKSQHQVRYRHVPGMLRAMREAAGLTQRDLAQKLRTSQPWVHKSEIGERRVDIAEFIDWCAACNRDLDDAFHELTERRIKH